MKKTGITAIVVTIVVIAIVAVLYLAYVGYAATAPNVGPSKDPTGKARGPIAYAIFNIQCKVILGITSWTGKGCSVTVQTYPWVNGTNTINQVYQHKNYDPLGLLSSNFVGWITLKVTGPANYIPATYTSDKQTVKQNAFDFSPRTMTFGPYTAKFWDPGQYSITVIQWTPTSSSNSTPLQVQQCTQTFTISAM